MLFPSATVVAMVLSFVGATPAETRPAARGGRDATVSAPSLKIAAGLWAPKKASKPRPPREDTDAREEELLKPARAPAGGGDGGSRPRRRPIKMDDSAEEGDEEGAEEDDEEDEEEDRPKVVKRRKRVVEEEEEEAEPIASQPSIIPRLFNFQLGGAMIRRSFAYDVGTQQGDKGVRLGYALGIETFPLVSRPSGWYRTLGIGIQYEKQYGDATYNEPMTGMFTGYNFSQSRLAFDARYAIPAGEWVVVMPAVGYGRVGADLERMTPSMPGTCVSASTEPCFADVVATYLSMDLHIRVAFTPTFAMSLAGGYLLGIAVGKGTDQITAGLPGGSMKGFHVDLGASALIADWLAVQATIPIRRYSIALDAPASGTPTYRGATDMYYGLIAGIALMTK
jgi:hypothetical protein